MPINDPVYGQFEITEPLLIELLASGPVNRIKKIQQFGVPTEYYFIPGFSRYEHSVGVMLLLRRVGASVEEQAAGLLHDVSHTAFSHVVDWLLGDPAKEDFQDNRHLEVLQQSELSTIATRHGVSIEQLADYHPYSLLERPAPELCADRVDYALREMWYLGRTDIVAECVGDLRAHRGRLAFARPETAELFGRQYLDRQQNNWGGGEARLRYKLFADLLRQALELGLIERDDLFTDDETVMNKLLAANHPLIQERLAVLRQPFTPEFITAQGGENLQKKQRYVDPYFIDGDHLMPISQASPDFRATLEAYLIDVVSVS